MPTAILVDGSFFLKRYSAIYGTSHAPDLVANNLVKFAHGHLALRRHRGSYRHEDNSGDEQTSHPPRKQKRRLYRLFYYDCPPLTKKAHHPLTHKSIDFSRSALAHWRKDFLDELKKKRKVALRLGYLEDRDPAYLWKIKAGITKDLLRGRLALEELTDHDVVPDIVQKGVDMRIGLDIASMAYKRQVDQIVLIAGDSDFVPAAKLARREGIDFILDPMWASIRDDLFEHIDGLYSTCQRPQPRCTR